MLKEQKIIDNGQIQLTIEIPHDQMVEFLNQSANQLSQETKIPGFRPGNAPYDVVKKRFGEMKIYEHALEKAVPKTYLEAIKEKKLLVVGQPEIQVDKLAPGNPIVYTATVALLPEVKLGDYQNLKIKRKEIKITDEEINKVLKDLQKSRGKEKIVDRPAKSGDKVTIDFQMFNNKVPLENGQHKDYPVIIGEHKIIPGLEDKLIGTVKENTKEFSLKFPKEHFDKNMADKEIDFKVTIKGVYEVELPEINDEFAQSLGPIKSAEELKNKLEENLQAEKKEKEEQRFEGELLNKIIKQSEFQTLPKILINNEAQKMKQEFESMITKQGIKLADYLKNIKKTEEEILKDFEPTAIERVKTALMLREVAKQENIIATDKEISEEIAKLEKAYAQNPEILDSLKQADYREYLKNILTSRKTINLLKSIADKS